MMSTTIRGFNVDGEVYKYDYAALENISVQTAHIHDGAVTPEKLAASVPSANGTYRLCCSITDGTTTFYWTAE